MGEKVGKMHISGSEGDGGVGKIHRRQEEGGEGGVVSLSTPRKDAFDR